MPVHMEKPERLSRAIQSCLSQTDHNLELIIVQDDDKSYKAVIPKDPRIVLAKTGEIAAGPSKARNIGLNLARGKFITFLDSDDFFELNKLEVMIPYAEISGACFDNTRYGYEYMTCEPKPYVEGPHATTGRKDFSFFAVIDKPLWPVYRADLITGLRFLETIRFSEDSLFNYQAILRRGSAFFCSSSHHNYVIRQLSASHGPDNGLLAENAYKAILQALSEGKIERGDVLRPAYERKRQINLQYIAWVSNPLNEAQSKDYQTYLRQSELAT